MIFQTPLINWVFIIFVFFVGFILFLILCVILNLLFKIIRKIIGFFHG